VSRCVKRVFKNYIQSVSSLNLSAAIAHFLNCFLSHSVKVTSNTPAPTPTSNGAQSSTSDKTVPAVAAAAAANDAEPASNKSSKKRKKNQKKNNRYGLNEQINNDWASLSPRSLWSQISDEAMAQYHFDLKLDNNDEQAFTKLKLRKLTLLRSFCQKNGVQLLLRDFNLDSKHKEAFHEDDVLNMYPIVKHVPTKATDAYNFFTNGQTKIQQGFLKEGFELISESYNLLTNVYGALHPEICMCLRLLSRLNYILGDYAEALSTQHKAVMMCERLFGVDHSQTITEYSHLALYSFANGQINSSLKLLYRARYLLLVNYGEDHPEMSLIDSNLGLILQAASEYEYALRFLERALELNKKYFGAKSMKTALSYHLLARLQSCRGDFRTALMNERETYQIYKCKSKLVEYL
jgi:protein TIF31